MGIIKLICDRKEERVRQGRKVTAVEGYAVLVEEAGFDTEAEKMAENHLIFVDAEKSQENYAIPSAFAAYAKYMGIRLGNEKFLETD